MYLLGIMLGCAVLLGLVGGLLTKDVIKEKKRAATARFMETQRAHLR
jgi:hypothetical protein